ncbi:MAG: four helix bundle protein [bacterium]|nr:four helix bundle protein [bacterium]
MFLFENLDVYQRSLKLAINICKIANNFSIKFSRLRDQFIGAGISVPLNIAEGSGRDSQKGKKNFYKISRTSLFELIPILEICLNLELINKIVYNEFKEEIESLSKMLSGLMKSLE